MPPALVEWSTKAARDAFYSSPQLPRLLNPDAIRRTISDGVAAGQLGLATKDASGRLKLEQKAVNRYGVEESRNTSQPRRAKPPMIALRLLAVGLVCFLSARGGSRSKAQRPVHHFG